MEPCGRRHLVEGVDSRVCGGRNNRQGTRSKGWGAREKRWNYQIKGWAPIAEGEVPGRGIWGPFITKQSSASHECPEVT